MKRYLLIALLGAGFIGGCSKSDDNTKTDDGGKKEEYKIDKVSFDRTNVGVNQVVVCSINKPSWAGDVVTYKWEFTNSKGETGYITTDKNSSVLSPYFTGNYKVKVYLSSKGIEANNTNELNVIDCDFGVGIFGNDKKVIIDAKEFAGMSPETGLGSGFYWPFEAGKPSEYISFKTGNSYEKYIFSNGKFTAGTTELINEPFRSSSNGVERNLAYYRLLDLVDRWNKSLSTNVAPVIKWRAGVTEDQKKKYETIGTTKNDGIGWALLNKDITEITADWSNTKVEAKARISAQADNSKYEMRFAIRKK